MKEEVGCVEIAVMGGGFVLLCWVVIWESDVLRFFLSSI